MVLEGMKLVEIHKRVVTRKREHSKTELETLQSSEVTEKGGTSKRD